MRDFMKMAAFAAATASVAACGVAGSAGGPATKGTTTTNITTGVVVAATVAGGSDWPNFRGPNGNGISPETGINKNWSAKPPKLLWKVDLADKGYAGPAVANNMVFIIDHAGSQDIVRALSLANGQEAWRYAYDDTDKPNYGFARSTPTVNGGKVYVMSRLGVATCLDAKTGKVLWTKDVNTEFGGQRPGWDLAGSPFIDGNKLILTPGGQAGMMVALDKGTGAKLWQGGLPSAPGYSTPVKATINGVKQYVVMFAKGVMGVHADNGAALWNAPWQTSYDVNAADPIVIGNAVYVTSGYRHGCGVFDVAGSSATLRWENKEIQGQFASSILYKDMIYGTGDPGNLVCLDPKTGQTLWKQPGFEKGGCVAVDGTIIALNGSNGDVIMAELSPTGYKELGRLPAPLGGQSWTAPIVAQGKLIIRNTTAIACLDLR